ncbi:hypothetical protein HYV86_06165 [Candidatus Woesearchaeota archaeon]|nr:hypothetical protein [Candidatus Woesearchaeota archaeon]
MKWSALVHPGFEDAFIHEATALLPQSSPHKIGNGIVSGTLSDPAQFLTLLHYSHLSRRLLIDLGSVLNLEQTPLLPASFPWEKFFTNGRSFRVEIEGVPGQENRLPIAKQVAGALFSQLETHKIIPTLELRNPQQLVLVYFDGEKYFFGIDVLAQELDARQYRLFAHAASFKGDSQAYFLSLLGYKEGQKLLVGFAKDGSAAIEAATIANHYPLTHDLQNILEIPYFTSCTLPLPPSSLPHEVYTFDETTGNLLSIRKNATLAGVAKAINARKQSIEDLDVAYGDAFFDCLLFHLTRKDEEKLNEIYYQSALILKPKGKMLIVGRATLELPIPEKFTLLDQRTLERGQSLHNLWLLEKA